MIDYLFDLLDFWKAAKTALDLDLTNDVQKQWKMLRWKSFGNGSGTVSIGGSVLSIVNDADRPLLMSTPGGMHWIEWP